MTIARRWLSRVGTAVIAILMLAGGLLVLWNVFGMGPYGDACRFSIGCKSFMCLQHELAGSAQVASAGRCTQSCVNDDECGGGAKCVVLAQPARDDLPPFGKPERACMKVRGAPSDVRP